MERVCAEWAGFLEQRAARLEQQQRHGHAAEKVAENIVEDLFTRVLDWGIGDLNNQIGYADIVLTSLGIKQLVIEVKRPYSLARRRKALEAALDQARRYADEQRVKRVAVSDGVLFYAADIHDGGLRARTLLSLVDEMPPADELWWVSTDGIWRSRPGVSERTLSFEPEPILPSADATAADPGLLHPKYKLPCHCFAYVGNAGDTSTWKLPYLCADGQVDERRLPGAIRSIIANYRGTKVMLPESAVPEALARLGRAAASAGRIGSPEVPTPNTYRQLAMALEQLGLLEDVLAKPR